MHASVTRLVRLLVVLAAITAGAVVAAPPTTAATPPDANDGFETVYVGSSVAIQLTGQDDDVQPLTFAIATPPTSGTLSAIGPATCDGGGGCSADVDYTPTGAAGTIDSFTFTVSDGTFTSAPATVEVDILAAPGGSIVSPGPLTKITTSPLLNCAVDHAGDTSGEWYGETACGTFVAVGGALFGPASVPAGSGATGATGYQAYTAVSQNGPTGTGSAGSPYVLTTVVDLGGVGLRLTQTDSYVVGQESYRTDVSLTSTDNAPHTAIVYRAGDCYLQDSDEGVGQVFSGSAPSCKAEPSSADPNRIEGFFPLTGGSHYMEASFSQVWSAVGAKTQLPDTCRCAELIDNGSGVSWPAAVAATGSTTIASLTVFSPVGGTPVSLTKTADDPDVEAGAADGYTVTISNPGAVAQTLTTITDTLPAGFSYVAGSSTGVTTTNPNVSGQTLTWSGSFSVPAATGGTPGTSTLHFGVHVSQTPGTYTNSVSAAGTGVTVIAANGVAPITVTPATVDTTPPDTTITAGPTGTTNDNTPTFSFTATEAGSTFECRVDAGVFASCSTPFTTAALSDGAHTFEVRATDAALNTDQTPASRSFTVDTTAPDTTITAGPTGTTNDNTPTFSFTATEAGSTFQCRVDAGAFAACTTPFTTAALSDGAHTFEVRATDTAGNTDPTPASRAFSVDTTPPDTTITAGPTGATNDNTPTFSFTATEAGSTFQCRVDAGAFAACTTPFTTAALADGAHTFDVRATDTAGNTDPTPASRAFSVDTTAPDTTITAGPTGTTSDSTPTFSFTSNEAGSTFQCRVDAAAFASCSSPFTTATLADGPHTFEVRATDAVGLTDPTPASRSFTVDTTDTTPPDTTITAGPSGTTSDSTPTFSFTSEVGATFECRVDAAAFASCSSPFTTATLADGPHTFEVRAMDGLGNVDPTPASRAFNVDTTAPDTTITSGPAASSTDTTPTFAFVGTGDATSFECRMDGGAWAACTSPSTTTVGLGAHTFEVRAIDAVGNVDGSPAAAAFTVTAPPPPPVPSYTCGGRTATIIGTSGADVLTGTGGNDVIVGLDGNDKINGGGGHDLICGGDGNDTIQGASGKDIVDGGGGNDKLFGGGGADQIDGGAGRDRIQGNGGDDQLVGGGGDDELTGDAGDDELVGSGGDDDLAGGGGDDDLSGGAGDDHLDGGAGRDKGDGGAGVDVIVRCES